MLLKRNLYLDLCAGRGVNSYLILPNQARHSGRIVLSFRHDFLQLQNIKPLHHVCCKFELSLFLQQSQVVMFVYHQS